MPKIISIIMCFNFECLLALNINELEITTMLDNIILQISLTTNFLLVERSEDTKIKRR
jgi:hypothetical protein